MIATTDHKLLDSCCRALTRADFDPAVLTAHDPKEIGGAAMRLAQAQLRANRVALQHPLGFCRIALTNWDLGASRIAVHVWDLEGGSSVSDDVHDHCYDFVSLCHTGRLEHQFFRLGDGVANPTASMAYPAGSCETATSAPAHSPTSLIEGDRVVIEAPQYFRLNHNELHSAKPLSPLVITIQFQSPCRKASAQVYRRSDRIPLAQSMSLPSHLLEALERLG